MPKMDSTLRSVIEINCILDRECDNTVRLAWACNRVVWLWKFRKISEELKNALCTKATAVLDGDWYENQPEEAIIQKYIGGK